jgi:hypothetical protein
MFWEHPRCLCQILHTSVRSYSRASAASLPLMIPSSVNSLHIPRRQRTIPHPRKVGQAKGKEARPGRSQTQAHCRRRVGGRACRCQGKMEGARHGQLQSKRTIDVELEDKPPIPMAMNMHVTYSWLWLQAARPQTRHLWCACFAFGRGALLALALGQLCAGGRFFFGA